MRSNRRRLQLLLATVLVLETAAAPAFAQSVPWDPWEPFNRKMYAFHNVLDRHFFGPVARSWGRLPRPVRQPIVNFATNLSEPVVFVNDVLQGRLKTAGGTLGRFVMNSTVGLAGTLDVARHNHLPHHDNGFGTTLGRWGAQPGPYLFIPVIGPSDFRDSIGMVGQIFLDPLYYAQFDGKLALSLGTGVVNGLQVRLDAEQALSNIAQTSTDPYATLRSYFLQNRQAAIEGNPAVPLELPEFDTGPDETAPSPATVPEGSAPPPGSPPAVSQPPSAGGAPPIGGGSGAALPSPSATPANPPGAEAPPPAEPAPGDAAPPASSPSTPPATSPKWLVQPDVDGPLLTAGGK